ncbi:unnamed protein product, partial [Didymodactylos carnosus]
LCLAIVGYHTRSLETEQSSIAKRTQLQLDSSSEEAAWEKAFEDAYNSLSDKDKQEINDAIDGLIKEYLTVATNKRRLFEAKRNNLRRIEDSDSENAINNNRRSQSDFEDDDNYSANNRRRLFAEARRLAQ